MTEITGYTDFTRPGIANVYGTAVSESLGESLVRLQLIGSQLTPS